MKIVTLAAILLVAGCSDSGRQAVADRSREAEAIYLRAVSLEGGTDQEKMAAYSSYGRLRTEYLDTRFAQMATEKSKAFESEYLKAMTREAARAYREGAAEAVAASKKE